MDTLGKLFGSRDIVRILRMFLLNPEEHFELSDVEGRTKVDRDIVRQEVSMLERIGFVKKRSFYKKILRKRGGKEVEGRKRVSGYILDDTFEHLASLRQLVVGNNMVSTRDVTKKLARAGRLKLVVFAGIFADDLSSRLDLLVVGDRLHGSKLEHVIRDLEAEVGREIRFATFSTADFKYRLAMQDRLLRDTFDYAHHTAVDRLGADQAPTAVKV